MNGQTIKTRVLTEALVSSFGGAMVSMLDTASVFRKPLAFYAAARNGFAKCTHIILLPGPRAVYVILPLFLRWRKRQEKDIRYVVIGGFLPDYVEKNRWLRRLCMQLDGIYVETQSMADRIVALGVTNARVLPNFRSFNLDMPRNHAPVTRPVKLVFCARIFKEKGIEEAITAANNLNATASAPVVSLDVFGPVEEGYQQRFTDVVKASGCTTYKGVLPSADVHSVLQHYDLMVFPTYYYGEGFAGTIVDAFIAGVPVIASDWAYNPELIDPDRTGALCSARSVEDLTSTLKRYVDNPQLVTRMRQHCVGEARRYHVDHALKGLLLDIANSSDSKSRRRFVTRGTETFSSSTSL